MFVNSFLDDWRRNSLRWFGHVERTGEGNWVKRCARMEVEGNRPRGRPRMEVDGNRPRGRPMIIWMTSCAVSTLVAMDRSLWQGRIHVVKRPTRVGSCRAVKPTCVCVMTGRQLSILEAYSPVTSLVSLPRGKVHIVVATTWNRSISVWRVNERGQADPTRTVAGYVSLL
jgi:hypothetical protein